MKNTRASARRVALSIGVLGVAAATLVGCDSAPTAPGRTVPVVAPVVAPAVPAPLVGISLTASPSRVTAGEQLTVVWVAPAGRGCNGGGDWLALYKVGDPDDTGAANGHSDLWFEHLCGGTSGTFRLPAPAQAGDYEFRYMAETGSAARSNPVTVDASGQATSVVPTLLVDGESASVHQIGETFWFSGRGYTAGGTLTRHITPAVNGSTVLTPTLSADASGNMYWTFTPQCGNPKGAYVIYAVDDATGQTTSNVTQTITGSATCP